MAFRGKVLFGGWGGTCTPRGSVARSGHVALPAVEWLDRRCRADIHHPAMGLLPLQCIAPHWPHGHSAEGKSARQSPSATLMQTGAVRGSLERNEAGRAPHMYPERVMAMAPAPSPPPSIRRGTDGCRDRRTMGITSLALAGGARSYVRTPMGRFLHTLQSHWTKTGLAQPRSTCRQRPRPQPSNQTLYPSFPTQSGSPPWMERGPIFPGNSRGKSVAILDRASRHGAHHRRFKNNTPPTRN